jgi:hypothetical protein
MLWRLSALPPVARRVSAARDYFGKRASLVFAAIFKCDLCDRKSKGGGFQRCRRLLETPGNALVMFPEGVCVIDDRVGTSDEASVSCSRVPHIRCAPLPGRARQGVAREVYPASQTRAPRNWRTAQLQKVESSDAGAVDLRDLAAR